MRGIIAAVAMTLLSSTVFANKMNIVMIMTDDQDDDGTVNAMPFIQGMIDRGIRFTNNYSSFPLCGPARASMLSGQYSHNTGVVRNNRAEDIFQPGEGDSLGPWMQAAGYKTAMIGKYINGFGGGKIGSFHTPPGWDEFAGWKGKPGIYSDFLLYENGTLNRYGPEFYSTSVYEDIALKFVNDHPDDPIFLLVTPNAPHVPHTPEEKYQGAYASLPFPLDPAFNEADVSDKPLIVQEEKVLNVDEMTAEYRQRREALLSVDDMMKHLVEAMGDRAANTVFIFTSDNGWSQGQHRWRGKHIVYDQAAKVPLAITYPGAASGQVREQLTVGLDLTPTLLEIAGATPGHAMDGRSLVPLINDPNKTWRTALLLEGGDYSQNWNYSGIRTSRYVYAADEDHRFDPTIKFRELYDLIADPWQLENRDSWASYLPVGKFARDTLNAVQGCVGNGCWITATEPSRRRTK